MGHCKNDCPKNPRNKKRNIVKEGSPKKNKTEESEIKDLYY